MVGLWIMLAVIVLLLVANLLFVSFVFHRQQMMMCKMKMGMMMDKAGCKGEATPETRCLSQQSQCGPMAKPMGGCPMQSGAMMRGRCPMRGGMMNRGMMMQRMPMHPMVPHMQGRQIPHGQMGPMMMRGQSMTAPAMPMMQARATRVMPAIPLTPAMPMVEGGIEGYEEFCRTLPEGARIQAMSIEDIDPEVLERLEAQLREQFGDDFDGIRLEIDGDELIHARTIRISDDRIACPRD